MNATTPIQLTEQDELDRMARNRASANRIGSLAQPAAVPPIPPAAFRIQRLTDAVRVARDALAVADCNRREARGRVAKEKLRPAVNRARTGLRNAEAALAAEMRGEELAEAVLREDVMQRGGPLDGIILRQAQIVVSERGRVEQVTALGRLIRYKSLTAAQGAALVRYREAVESAAAGLFGTGLNPDAVGGGGTSVGGNFRIENAVADGALLAAMRGALFPRGISLVEHVVVRGLTVESWAATQVSAKGSSMNQTRAMGLLEAAADTLMQVKDA